MRRDLIKDVKIIEPPLEELSRKYSRFSSLKRTCCAGCGCLLLSFIILIIILRLVIGTGPVEIKQLPAGFRADIPIYDKENIEKMTYISGEYKNKVIEIAAIVPKIVLAPVLMILNNDENTNDTAGAGSASGAMGAINTANTNAAGATANAGAANTVAPKIYHSLKNYWQIISTPVSDRRDVILIQWTNLNVEPDFIASYYKLNLQKNYFKITAQSKSDTIEQFSFSKDDANVSGAFYAEQEVSTGKTKKAILTVNYEP